MRRYGIGSLRVIAFALLILYHVGMFFVPWGFHIKNNVIYPEIRFPMLFLVCAFNIWSWILALFGFAAFWPKFSIMALGTFGGCWLIYEFCIRR